MLQPLQIWRSEADALTVCAVEQPELTDVHKLCSFRLLRAGMLQWKYRLSDTEGCVDLYHSEVARPSLSSKGLLDLNCPLYMVLDQLRQDGRQAIQGNPGDHMPTDDSKMLCLQNAMSRKRYYQCLLALPSLFTAGLPSLPRSASVSYYTYMLIAEDKAAVTRWTPASEIAKLLDVLGDKGLALAGATDDRGDDHVGFVIEDELAEPDVPPRPPSPLALPDRPSGVVVDSSDEGEGREVVAAVDGDAAVVAMSPDEVTGEAIGVGEHRGAYPRDVDGYHLREDEYHGRHGHYHRLQLTCPYHGNCMKSRNTGAAQTAHYGWQEPLAFLAVWAAKGQFAATKVDHHAMHPSLAEQKAWLVEHFPAEFVES